MATLITNVPCIGFTGEPSTCTITSITTDSREVLPGSLFIALSGTECDGHDFIDQAVARGCAAVIVEKDHPLPPSGLDSKVCIVEVVRSRTSYGLLAEAVFGYPAQEMTLYAVTGTNGKTTVSYLLESILGQSGKQTGVMGTISYRYRQRNGVQVEMPSPLTTPEPLLLQETLRKMADNGVGHVIMEVSSHGLEQKRIGSLNFDVAAFTNLSRDHLDYHCDMEQYFAAKSLLFKDHLADGGAAVITFPKDDSSWSRRLEELCLAAGRSILSCGASSEYSIHPLEASGSVRGTQITLQTPMGRCEFFSPLVGEFNVMNIQTAVGMAFASGVSLADISGALAISAGAPGRMQRITGCRREQDFRPTVFVDYAHTPDALEKSLKTLAELPHASLTCVFGCGGDRDRGKRSLMGNVAGECADVVVITDDNPRSEDPGTIRSAIAEGVKLARRDETWLAGRKRDEQGVVTIGDRRHAISAAISAASVEDIVLIAGKGHEEYQLTSEGTTFFDDSLEAAESLCSWNLKSLTMATGGQLRKGDLPQLARPMGKISTDSRTVGRGDIFVALKGERFDGHAYVRQVADSGASCLVLEREPDESSSVPMILVQDSERALGDLAHYRRSCMRGVSHPVVAAITGSSGKTTVKEMCAAIFAEQFPEEPGKPAGRVLKTEGNFNNLIGLPLSLLPVSPKHEAVILEMGMNRPGEIERLTEIADPDIACILNIHGAHLEGLGDIEGVAKAKGELFQACAEGTVLVVNSDDHRVVALGAKSERKKVVFGRGDKNSRSLDIYSSEEDSQQEKITFTLHVLEKQAKVVLQVPGLHNVSNALAAAAIAHAAGLKIEVIARGLSAFLPSDRRMQILDGPSGSRIINDTYNANPASMKAGIRTLAGLGGNLTVAVLGDMLELGPASESLHSEIGAQVADSGIDYLGLVGDFASFTASGARKGGMDVNRVRVFSGQDECFDWFEELVAGGIIGPGSYVLVKGSRGMRLDDLVERLVKK